MAISDAMKRVLTVLAENPQNDNTISKKIITVASAIHVDFQS